MRRARTLLACLVGCALCCALLSLAGCKSNDPGKSKRRPWEDNLTGRPEAAFENPR